MKIVAIKGGLGNQLFQYAFACYLQQKGSNPVRLHWRPSPHISRSNRLDKFPIKLEFLSAEEGDNAKRLAKKMQWFRLFSGSEKSMHLVREDSSQPIDRQLHLNKKNAYYDGYWQSAAMVNSVRDILLNELLPFSQISKESRGIADRINNSVGATAIHLRSSWQGGMDIDDKKKKVRHKHNQTSLSYRYYAQAIRHLSNACGPVTLFVFADDIDLAEQVLSRAELPNEFIYLPHNKRSALEDVILMQLCQNFILSNSTFAWWGQWFSYARHPQKKSLIIMPKHWLGHGDNRSQSIRLRIHNRVILMADE